MKYRQHLDWHFCQNRRLKDSGHDQSRGWYFSLSDWMQYEEIEDPEETGMTCNSYLDMTWRTA
jgi:pre-mRNA cleavage complex 2 protein Pcf11